MSYSPKEKSAAKALAWMGVDCESEWWDYTRWDFDVVREVLIALSCPLVCDGPTRVDGSANGWHKLCIEKAEKAMSVMEVEL